MIATLIVAALMVLDLGLLVYEPSGATLAGYLICALGFVAVLKLVSKKKE